MSRPALPGDDHPESVAWGVHGAIPAPYGKGGTLAAPSGRVRQKAGFNRSILDGASALLFAVLDDTLVWLEGASGALIPSPAARTAISTPRKAVNTATSSSPGVRNDETQSAMEGWRTDFRNAIAPF